MTSPDTGIQLRTIGSLDGHTFHVPRYQRGYRWTNTQVTALLDDLLAWRKTDPEPIKAKDGTKKAPAYCLQPLVVVQGKKHGTFDVVDGQQRLTTLHLILEILRTTPEMKERQFPKFQVNYDRHPDGLAALITTVNQVTSKDGEAISPDLPPDLHFIHHAQRSISTWIEKNHNDVGMLAALFARSADALSPCVQFIWHELADKADAIPAFERLNSGKIPLTDAELIRGLLLKRGSAADDATRQRIALRWDQIERRMRDNEFWAFLGGDLAAEDTPEFNVCRIGLLFALNAYPAQLDPLHEHALFEHYEKSSITPDKLWDKLEELFARYESWFADHQFFHLAGLLVHLGTPMGEIVKWSQTMTKNEFIKKLITQLRNRALPGWDSTTALPAHLENIQYDRHNQKSREQIRALLLCFNVATLNSGTARLSFHHFRKEKWDIEHVRATNERGPQTTDELRYALDTIRAGARATLKHAPVNSPLTALKSDLFLETDTADTESPFTALNEAQLKARYERAAETLESSESIAPTNHLLNLALLDEKTNRSYGAALFAVKRQCIVDKAQTGSSYILPCTLSVFTKTYSKIPLNPLHWTTDDARDYFATMAKILTKFFDRQDEPEPVATPPAANASQAATA